MNFKKNFDKINKLKEGAENNLKKIGGEATKNMANVANAAGTVAGKATKNMANVAGNVAGNVAEKLKEAEKSTFREYMDFLKEYKIIGLAIAFIMGAAATTLVKSMVDNIIMPLITPFVPGGGWKTATLAMGPIVLTWGAFLADLINFVILGLVVFFIAKAILKEDKVTKK